MLFSLGLIIFVSLIFGKIFEKLKLPKLIGMIFAGILLGSYGLDLIDNKVMDMSSELRQVALIIILTRAGLNLNIDDLKKVGRPAILLSFIPATFEIVATTIFAPIFLGVSTVDALLIGTVLSAVSPAVIVPRMLNLMEKGYGKEKGVPQMVMASSAVDDIFVIVAFYVCLGLAEQGVVSASSFINIPISIILGTIIGIACGMVLNLIYSKVNLRETEKVLLLLAVAFTLATAEKWVEEYVSFSAMLSVMAMGICINIKKPEVAKSLSGKYQEIWVFAEMLLFVLVGAMLNIQYAFSAGIMVVVLILVALIVRLIGVYLCMLKTKLSNKEKLFVQFSFIPKATVQAGIGGIPLAMGLACGDIVLTVAVVAILVTAPLGAFLIDKSFDKLLEK